jgi:hypothetical protein
MKIDIIKEQSESLRDVLDWTYEKTKDIANEIKESRKLEYPFDEIYKTFIGEV